jgi:hypothetical protein
MTALGATKAAPGGPTTPTGAEVSVAAIQHLAGLLCHTEGDH